VLLACAFPCVLPMATSPARPVKNDGRGYDLRPRALAFDVMCEVCDDNRPLDEALRHSGVGSLPPQRRAFVRKLTTQTVRRIHQLDAVLYSHGELPTSRPLLNLLRLGATQLLILDVPEYAAVSTSLDLAQDQGMGNFKGLVNKRLRAVSEERAAHAARLADMSLALPPWLSAEVALHGGPEAVEGVGRAMLSDPPLDLTLRMPPGLGPAGSATPGDEASAGDTAAQAASLGGKVLAGTTVRLPPKFRGQLPTMPGYTDGAWWVQDLAASAPVRALAAGMDLRGARTVDLCAAPGGKALQLLAAGARLTAVDRSSARLERLRENLARCAEGADGEVEEVVRGDAARWARERIAEGETFDAVLLDAPCSGTGLVRRHPASVLKPRKAVDMRRLHKAQHELLREGCALLRPGGVLVYATCSLLASEGEAQVAQFLADMGVPQSDWEESSVAAANAADLQPRPPGVRIELSPLAAEELPPELAIGVTPEGYLRMLPCMCADQGGVDGFFVARFVRT